jgi:Protein of unknown function (DUF2934)
MVFLSTEAEQKVRDRAHAIWEAEGRPEGRHLEHWQQALSEFEREKAAVASPAKVVGSPVVTGVEAAAPEPEKKSPRST